MTILTNGPANFIIPSWSYADAATRTAATGFAAADVGKLAWQLDTNTLWMLTDESPITWVQVGGAGAAPGGGAGGVLSGTYPNPGFAVDMATQAELDAHTGDTTAAHTATALSFTPAGTIAATTVQAAIEEVASEAGGGSSTVFKQTVLKGNGNKTTTSTTFVAIDSTNLPYLTLAGLALGDVIELELDAQLYSALAAQAINLDVEVDRPTSANERANEACDSGIGWFASGGNRETPCVRTFYTVGEAGTHGFRPVWKVSGSTGTCCNATSGADDTPIIFTVRKLGPVTP